MKQKHREKQAKARKRAGSVSSSVSPKKPNFPNHRPNLVSRARFALLAGVSDSLVSRLCREHLAPAVVGRRLDIAHPVAAGYLAERGAEPVAEAPTPVTRGELSDLVALRDRVVREFGSAQEFQDWAQIRKLRAEAALAERRNDAHEGRLLSREHTRVFIWGAIESLGARLLGDVSVNLAGRLRGHFLGRGNLPDAIAILRDAFGTALTATKTETMRAIRAATAAAVDPPPMGADAFEPPPPPPPITRELHAALRACVHEKMAPRIVETTSIGIARTLAGTPHNHAEFDRVTAAAEAVRADTTEHAARMLSEMLDTTIRNFMRADQPAPPDQEPAT